MKRFFFLLIMVVFTACQAEAKVDLVSLPTRDNVQLTIYNSADLTLARENRALTLKKGRNELQFSWANTLIDPTSLEMWPKAQADQLDIYELVYPPRVDNLGLWRIRSQVSGRVPVEISYLTSGLSWRAFYNGTLSPDEKTMRLQGYVRVINNSGEDYEDAQVRLIVGKIHTVDKISDLARRKYPYGRPSPDVMFDKMASRGKNEAKWATMRMQMKGALNLAVGMDSEMMAPKEIVKEGLSEYFLYTIEGKETIPNGWAKRLPSFDVPKVPVKNLYKYEEERYGDAVVRFLSFKNNTSHQLGETPIPGGMIKVFRTADQQGHLSYEGRSDFKYVPVDEDVEMNLGPVDDVMIEITLMDVKTDHYDFDRKWNITGWNEMKEYNVEIKNSRDIPVKVEIKRNLVSPYWKIKNKGFSGRYEKEDKDTVKYTVELSPRETKEFKYAVTTFFGSREEK